MEIINKQLDSYLNKFYSLEPGLLGEIQKKALECNIPIIPKDTAMFLTTLLSVKKPKHILEIGTAVGFSAALFSRYLEYGGQITTIEKNQAMIESAKHTFEALGLNDKITILEGDAIDMLDNITGPFDVIFMDAAKGQYINILDKCLKLLKTGGILIADDVLQEGKVALEVNEIKRRNRTIRRRLELFLKEINSKDFLRTSIIPIGGGLSLSYKIF
ncbi:MAG: O-methyltransferase [Clostridiales bacterium]|jgi:predicted O-methyltransferase YrrM|nr:O-methyltransferase [Clostridiales bacterium]